MAGPRDQYLKEMAKRFKYRAVWTPDVAVELGDVGVMKSGEFNQVTTLKKLGVTFAVRPDDKPAEIEYSSSGAASITLKAAGQAAPPGSVLSSANAGVIVEISKKDSTVFHAMGVRSPFIDDKSDLGDKLAELYQSKKWKKDWVVVTEVKQCDSATILISSTKDSKTEFSLGAKAGGASVNLADASLGLTVQSSRGLNTKIVCSTALTPLFRVWALKGAALKAKKRAAPRVAALAAGRRKAAGAAKPKARMRFGELKPNEFGK